MAFGRDGRFPFRFGGGRSVAEQELRAQQTALAPGYDVEDPLFIVEARAQAIAIDIIWAVNRRLENQAVPERMIEALPDWEQAMSLRPAPSDRVQERRRAVAARFRSLSGNTLADIEAAAQRVLGTNYVEVRTVEDADATVYWPGVNPGPPGYEWSSNRAVVAIVMTTAGLSHNDIARLIDQLSGVIDAIIPAWMTYEIGADDGAGGFIVNQGIVGLTLL